MAKETQKEKIARLESGLEEMTKQRDSYRDEANNLKKQVNARVEETDAYKAIVGQLGSEQTKVKVAQDAQKRTDESNRKLRQFNAQLMQKLETLGVSPDEIESLSDNLGSATETAQDTIESAPDKQATEVPEVAQNGTQGDTEAIEEPLPEDERERLYKTNKQLQWLNLQLMQLIEDIGVPQDTVERLLNESENLLDGVPKCIQEFSEEWKKDMISKLKEAYETDNRPLSDDVAANIIATWCSSPRAEQALRLLYVHFLSPLDAYDEEEYKQFTKRQEEQAKIKEQEQTIAGLQAKIESAETTAQYNSVTEKYRLVDEQAKKIKALETARNDAITAQNTLKNDLEAVRAELQTLKQESAKNQKNPFGAGRKLKLTSEQVEQIKALSNDGLSYRQISERIGAAPATIMRYLKRS